MSDLLARAQAAARSARLLLDIGDCRRAVNRAYYAMFDLTRHMLRDLDPKLAAAKKHATIIGRFSKHMVQERDYPREAGQALRLVFDARLVADYSDIEITPEQAKKAVEAMERFFEAVAGSERPSPSD